MDNNDDFQYLSKVPLGEPKPIGFSIEPIVPRNLSEPGTVEEALLKNFTKGRGVRPEKKAAAPANIHAGRRERRREIYLRNGLNAFSDHEIVELLLYYCVPLGDVNPLAHRMLNTFGTLYNLFDAAPEEISKLCGVKMSTAILFSVIPELLNRYETSKWDKREPMDSSKKASAYLYSFFSRELNECMYLLCLDSQQALIKAVLLTRGTINEATVYPRTVVQQALTYNAAFVILAHNHPSGNLMPSQGDFNATQTIINALNPINVIVLDHIIIGGLRYYSFAEKKLMNLAYDKK